MRLDPNSPQGTGRKNDMAKQIKLSREVLTQALNRKRFAWVDSVMRDVLPADIYGSMHSGNPTDRLRATGWMREHGYRITDVGDGVIQIFRGTKLVRQTKMILELNDPDELLAVMESVTENMN